MLLLGQFQDDIIGVVGVLTTLIGSERANNGVVFPADLVTRIKKVVRVPRIFGNGSHVGPFPVGKSPISRHQSRIITVEISDLLTLTTCCITDSSRARPLLGVVG